LASKHFCSRMKCRSSSSLPSFTHTLNGSFGSDVRVILKVTFDLHASKIYK
jgi:hypothetical protein